MQLQHILQHVRKENAKDYRTAQCAQTTLVQLRHRIGEFDTLENSICLAKGITVGKLDALIRMELRMTETGLLSVWSSVLRLEHSVQSRQQQCTANCNTAQITQFEIIHV
jgi:hypothetical protein